MLQSKAGYIDARPLTASSAKPLATRGRTIHSTSSACPGMSVWCQIWTHAPQQIGRYSAGEMGVADYRRLVRGNTILNSVNCPGSVSTSIVPPCRFTMKSWLIDRPSPVPSPEGLVVKNGLNIFSLTSSGMPVPLSRNLVSEIRRRSGKHWLEAVTGFYFAFCRSVETVRYQIE